MAGIVIGFFEMALYCAIVIFIAYLFVWGLQFFLGIGIDGNVLKWGKVIVGLLCFLAFLTWLFSVLGLGGGFPHFFPHGYLSH